MMKNKEIFENIYRDSLWNNGNKSIPLSGPGSSLENTKDCSSLLNSFIYKNSCKSVLDLGCGDLTWISKTRFFNDETVSYTGVDVVESLITEHSINFPNNKFLERDIVHYSEFDPVSMIIIRDVIFHLRNEEILSIFNNIKNKFKFIAITSCVNTVNTDEFNYWRFTEKNIHKSPFNVPDTFLDKIHENEFNRDFYIFEHDAFYAVSTS